MVYVGGLRARLVKESLFNMFHDALESLDWFDSGRQHQPVTMRSFEVPDDEEIPLNTVVLIDEDANAVEIEMGSRYSEHRWTFYVDVYAESDAMGVHLAHDVKDILEGRMPTIGRSSNTFDVIDYTADAATPIVIAYAEIDEVSVQKAHGFPKPWQRHWYSVPMLVTDFYDDETYS